MQVVHKLTSPASRVRPRLQFSSGCRSDCQASRLIVSCHGRHGRPAASVTKEVVARNQGRPLSQEDLAEIFARGVPGVDYLDNQPFYMAHSTEKPVVTALLQETIIETNAAHDFAKHLGHWHPAFPFSVTRMLEFPTDASYPEGLPEAALYKHRHLYNGLVNVFVVQSGNKGETLLGSCAVLSPICQDDTGRATVAIASAEHVFKGLGQYDFGATTRYVDVGVLRTDHYSGVPRDFRITERATLMTDEELRASCGDPSQPVVAGPCSETPAYPAISEAVELPVRDAPDAAIVLLHPRSDECDEIFPFSRKQGFSAAADKLNFCVPTCMDPRRDFVVATGLPGSLTQDQMEASYGVGSEGAVELQTCMPSCRSVASAGDVIEYNGLYLVHRCSCHGGMSGSPLRLVAQPNAIVSIHLGGGSQCNAAVSVNHPLWVVWYCTEVLPLLAQLPSWPLDYMPLLLADWLLHHKELLQRKDLWEGYAAGLVARFLP